MKADICLHLNIDNEALYDRYLGLPTLVVFIEVIVLNILLKDLFRESLDGRWIFLAVAGKGHY